MKSFPKFSFSVENKFTRKYVLHQIYLFILIFEGGTEVGWTPLSSVILWRRMLGIMGNINHIKDPEIHATVFKHLIELWQMLANVSTLRFEAQIFFSFIFAIRSTYRISSNKRRGAY